MVFFIQTFISFDHKSPFCKFGHHCLQFQNDTQPTLSSVKSQINLKH